MKKFYKPAELMFGIYDELSKKTSIESAESGLSTGYRNLDTVTSGFHPKDLILLASRPAVGKTALASNIALNTSQAGEKVVYFSLETSAQALMRRMAGIEGMINSSHLLTANMSQKDWLRLDFTLNSLFNRHLYINDSPAISTDKIREYLGDLEGEIGRLDLIIIDFLQLLGEPGENMFQMVGQLKRIARGFEVPIIVLSQLERQVENRPDRRPRLTDIRGRNDVVDIADTVIMLCEAPSDTQKAGSTEMELLIRKNNHGELATVKLSFIKEVGRFFENGLG